jgi:mono/diheme cytochrome c family protein
MKIARHVEGSDALGRIKRFCGGSLAVLFFFAGPALCFGAADEGQKLLEQKCASCHGMKKATAKGRDEAKWRSTILRMKGNGADLSQQDIETLTAYMAKNYPAQQ